MKPSFVVAFAFIALAGCDHPYDLTIGKINEKPPQTAAVIALSDPQVYTRERLLNDRAAEATFLTDQLKHVDDQDYTPRLKRDIDTLLEVMAAISAKFDPVAGASIAQAAEINSLKNEAEIAKLRNLLADIKAQQTLAADTSGGTSQDASGLAPTDIGTLITQIETGLTALEAAMGKRPGVTTPRSNTVSKATPEEVFDAKLAYRHRVVSALQQAEYDDRHDLGGNSLYRLQFRATVFPGPIKDKYAVARITIKPPKFTNADVSRLYLDWLAYVAEKLNPGSGLRDSARQSIANHYRLVGPATGAFAVRAVPLKEKTDATEPKVCDGLAEDIPAALETTTRQLMDNCHYFLIPTPPELSQFSVSAVAGDERTNDFVNLMNALQQKIAGKELTPIISTNKNVSPGHCTTVTYQDGRDKLPLKLDPTNPKHRAAVENFDKFLTDDSSDPERRNLQATIILTSARDIVNLAPAYMLAVDRAQAAFTRDERDLDDPLRKTINRLGLLLGAAQALYTQVNLTNDAASNKKKDAASDKNDADADNNCGTREKLAGRVWVPDAFYSAVVDPNVASEKDGRVAEGTSFAYSAAPAALSQRISTVASATRALDLMASVSALLPGNGLGLSASGKLRQIASGRVDAIESVPLIVGFSNNGNEDAAQESPPPGGDLPREEKKRNPSFGWVFGPKVVPDTAKEQLALTQVLRQEPVTADLSLPGWWPSVTLQVETAWIANFQHATIAPDSPKTTKREATTFEMRVDLPTSLAKQRFESLTERLADQAWGSQHKAPTIVGTFPEKIFTCEDTKVLIQGSDLWRRQRVYLNGVAAKGVQILPDMNGLEASFNLPASVESGASNLVVWTQLGKTEHDGPIIQAGTCPKKGATSSPGGIDAALPKLSPGKFPVAFAGEEIDLVSEKEIAGPYTATITAVGGDGKALITVPVVKADDSKKKFTLKMPNSGALANVLGVSDDGPAISIVLNQVKDGAETSKAAATPVYVYFRKIETILSENSHATIDPDGKTGSVEITAPKTFLLAYGKDITVAHITGSVAGSELPGDVPHLNVESAGYQISAKFDTRADWQGKKINEVLVDFGHSAIQTFRVSVD